MAKPITIRILGDASQFDKVVGSVDKGMGKISGLATKVGGILVAAFAADKIASAISAGFNQALDIESLNARLSAQLGVTGEVAANLGETAGDLYSSGFGENLGQVNDAIANVMRNIGDTGAAEDSLDRVAGKVLNLSDVFGEDLERTTSAVGQMLRTGLADNADEALDILTVGFQNGANKAGDLLDTVNEYGTLFREVGIDGETMTGLLTQGLQAGARDADKVADAIGEFSKRARDGSTLTAEGFTALGMDAGTMAQRIAAGGDDATAALDETLDALRAMEDPLLRDQAAVKLFGTQAEDLGDALYALDPSTAVEALGDVAGAADKMGDGLAETNSAKIERFKRQGLMALADLMGEHVIPALEAILPHVQNFGTFLSEVGRRFQSDLWPHVQQGFAWLQANVPPVIEAVRLVFANLVAWATENLVPLIQDKLLPMWQAAFEAVFAIVDTIVKVVLELWGRFGSDLLGHLEGAIGNLVQAVGGLYDMLRGVFELIKAVLTGNWGEAWESIKTILSGAWNVILGVIKGGFDLLKGLFEVAKGTLSAAWSFIWNSLSTSFSDAWGHVKNAVSAGIDAVVDFFRQAPGRIGGVMVSLSNVLTAPFRTAFNGIATLWNNTVGSLSFSVPDWVPGMGGNGFSMPRIPTFRAMGGAASGFVRVGEMGPETVLLPRGSHVVPSHAGGPGGTTVNVYADTNADPYAISSEVAWAMRFSGR